MTLEAPRDNTKGGIWLLADMSLNIWALSIVKWMGADYAATQVVFLRALVGLVLIAPLVWRHRAAFVGVPDRGLHLLRVVLSVITLTASYYAISRVPLALFTAIGFTRPIMTMLMAAAFLGEAIRGRQWLAAGVALAGVMIAVGPSPATWGPGLIALGIVVISGSGAIIMTRRLRRAPPIVMMAFYTIGLTVVSAPPALAAWQPIAQGDLVPLVLVGCFAQAAQLCFLRAHFHGTAGFLSVLGYLSLVLSAVVGYVVFGEEPGLVFALGAALVVLATLWGAGDGRMLRQIRPMWRG